MTNLLAVRCFAAVLYLISTTAAAEAYRNAIEDGKSYGAAVNSEMPDASALDPASVPGYDTSNPPEAGYYDNTAGLGEAANQAAALNEAAQSVRQGFATRPMFTIDRSTDPMFKRMDQVEANAASIAGAMQGEYSSCQPVTLETPHPTTTEMCYEHRPAEKVACDNTLNVEVDEVFSCEPGTWHAQGYASRDIIGDHVNEVSRYAQSYCEARTDGKLRFRIYASSNKGTCSGWKILNLPTTPIRGYTKVGTVTYRARKGCASLDYWVGPDSGCVGNNCRYDFWSGSPQYTCPAGKVNGAALRHYDYYGENYERLPANKCYYLTRPDYDGFCRSGEVKVEYTYGHLWDQETVDRCASYAGLATVSGVSGPKISLTFEKPHYKHIITDSWHNGCEGLEARSE